MTLCYTTRNCDHTHRTGSHWAEDHMHGHCKDQRQASSEQPGRDLPTHLVYARVPHPDCRRRRSDQITSHHITSGQTGSDRGAIPVPHLILLQQLVQQIPTLHIDHTLCDCGASAGVIPPRQLLLCHAHLQQKRWRFVSCVPCNTHKETKRRVHTPQRHDQGR